MSAFVRRALSFLLACLAAGSCIAGGADPGIRVERENGVFRISAELPVAVDPQIAWQVLTDYNHLADFVPDLQSSRVVSRQGRSLRVEQKGESGFFIFRFPIMVVLELEEVPFMAIRFHSVAGNVKDMKGEWRIEGTASPIRLQYRAQLAPRFWVPPLIGRAVVRHDVEDQLKGVIDEMLRRAKALRKPAPAAAGPNAADAPRP